MPAFCPIAVGSGLTILMEAIVDSRAEVVDKAAPQTLEQAVVEDTVTSGDASRDGAPQTLEQAAVGGNGASGDASFEGGNDGTTSDAGSIGSMCEPQPGSGEGSQQGSQQGSACMGLCLEEAEAEQGGMELQPRCEDQDPCFDDCLWGQGWGDPKKIEF